MRRARNPYLGFLFRCYSDPIYWNTKHLGQAVGTRQRAGLNCDPALLAQISPLGWAHILLTGEYRWRRQAGAKL